MLQPLTENTADRYHTSVNIDPTTVLAPGLLALKSLVEFSSCDKHSPGQSRVPQETVLKEPRTLFTSSGRIVIRFPCTDISRKR